MAGVTVRGATDVEGLEREPDDEDAELFVDRFVVTVDFGRIPAGIVSRDIVRDLKRAVGAALVDSASALVSSVFSELEASPSPSPAGAPPAMKTGELLRSIRVRPDDDGLGFAVGSDLAYAAHLEFGTTAMPARPFLFPALEQERRRIEANIRRAALVRLHAQMLAKLREAFERLVSEGLATSDEGLRRKSLPELIELYDEAMDRSIDASKAGSYIYAHGLVSEANKYGFEIKRREATLDELIERLGGEPEAGGFARGRYADLVDKARPVYGANFPHFNLIDPVADFLKRLLDF